MLKLISTTISLSLILTGSLMSYYNSYKDSGFLNAVSYLLLFIGWIIIMFTFFGKRLLKSKNISFKKNKNAWLRQKSFAMVCYSGFAALLLTNFIIVNNLTQKRVLTLLENGNTKHTVATVTRLENRNSRGGPKPYAIINYQTNYKKIEQATYNYKKQFWVGQKLVIKYSVDYPEMFEIVAIFK